ncbi:PAN domain-containing protein [Ditylenchus destructor]|nr:PAN domain-containing protein [Ditylenchus destructor]
MLSIFFVYFIFILASSSLSDAARNSRKTKERPLTESSKALCENLMSAFYVSDNIRIVANASAVVHNVTEENCMELCATNRDNKGRLVFCASVVYDRDQSICSIYRRNSAPDGELERKSEFGKRYFEKFCLAEDAPVDCANKQFVRVDDYILKGYAQATAVFPTMAECVSHCIREKEFECKSAMYFYEEGECITNLESAITRPDDFMKPDDDDKVVFFHNGCVQHGSPPSEIAASQDEEQRNLEEATKDNEAMSDENNTEESELGQSTTLRIETEAPTTQAIITEKVPISSTVEQTSSTPEPTTETEPVTEASPKAESLAQSSTAVATSEAPTTSASQEPVGDKEIVGQDLLKRKLEARLYGAKQLELANDGSLHEKRVDENSSNEQSSPFVTEAPKASGQIMEKLAFSGNENRPEHSQQQMSATTPQVEQPLRSFEPTKHLQLKPIKADKTGLSKPETQEDGYFSKWGEWTPCTTPGERRIRRRKCLDLRRCKGALMQVDYCPKDLPQADSLEETPTESSSGPIGPVRNPLPINSAPASSSAGSPPSILPPVLPQKELKPLPAGAPGNPEDVWSPWLGTCQHFASTQPCRNNEIIGFESRECIAKEPTMCKGPFFRYCTLPC